MLNPCPTPALQFHGFRTDAHNEYGRQEGELPGESGEVDDVHFFEIIPAGQGRLAVDGLMQFGPALEGTRKIVFEILHGVRAQLRVRNPVPFSKTDRCGNFVIRRVSFVIKPAGHRVSRKRKHEITSLWPDKPAYLLGGERIRSSSSRGRWVRLSLRHCDR